MMRKTYSKEQKEKIINQYFCGMTITEISKETEIARSTIYTWIKENNTKQKRTMPFNMREVLYLKQKCEQQEKMIKILQSASCTVTAPLSERYKAIQSLSDIYSITLLCKTLKVAKGSYYNHIFRNKNENTLAAQKRSEITPIIEKIFNDSNQVYGASKIHAIIKDRGYHISPNTVANIMHDNGWFSIRSGSKKLYLNAREKKENILNQNFTAKKPNEIWVGDVTYFNFKQRTYYICVIIDLYSRKVVSHKISTSNSTQLTKGTFKLAYESRQPSGLLFHSDQGCNYTSKVYCGYLQQFGIRQSFSRASTPYDNSVIESFFKSLKAEKLYRTDFRSEREFKEAIKKYIHHYNSERPHSTLNYKTPDEYETIYFSKRNAFQE